MNVNNINNYIILQQFNTSVSILKRIY